MPGEANSPQIRASFTFRFGSQLTSFTSQAGTVGNSVDGAQSAIQRKRKELRALIRRFGSSKKTAERLKKRSGRASDNASNYVNSMEPEETAEGYEDEVNTTFATEDLSIETSSDSPLIDSPSARKRKRFAGIWEGVDVNVNVGMEQVPPEKRARTSLDGPCQKEEFKENVGPSFNF